MANEFVARRGIIAQSGGAQITGSLNVSGSINAVGYNVTATSFTGSFSGSLSAADSASYVQWSAIDNKPSGIVSSSGQVSFTGLSDLSADIVSSSTQVANFLPAGTVSSSTQVILDLASGVVSASSQVDVRNTTGIETLATTGSNTFVGDETINGSLTVTGSTKFTSGGATGSFTGSFTGDGSGLTGVPTTLTITGSDASTGSVDVMTGGLTFSGSNGISTTVAGGSVTIKAPLGTVSSSTQVVNSLPADTVSSSAQVTAFLPDGTVSSSGQVSYGGLSNIPSGIVSASGQVDVRSTTGIETLATTGSNTFEGVQTFNNTTNSPNYQTGSVIIKGGVGIAKDVNISGSLTITGLLTATSQSIQYVTSSVINIAENKITLNTTDALRFGGISVNDSGSATPSSGSLYWDSLNNVWLYQNAASASAYNSAIIIAGPENFGNLGEERKLIPGRVPVAVGDDHIDTAPASSSIRVAFDTGITHIEQSLYVTGSITSSVGFSGDGSNLTGVVSTLYVTGSDASTGSINLKTQGLLINGGNGISTAVSGQTLTVSAPVGTVSSSGQVSFTGLSNLSADIVSSSTQVKSFLPTDTVSSSTQVTAFLPNGTVSASAQYAGWVTASSQVQLGSVTGTTFSNNTFSFPQGVNVTGSLSAKDATVSTVLYSGSATAGIVGPVSNQVVATLNTGSYDAVHFDYVVKDGTNYRTGTVMAVWSGAAIEFTDTSTRDIGNTSGAVFVADLNGGSNARLKFSVDTGTWTVKTAIRAL